MGEVRVNINGPVTKASADLNCHTQNENKSDAVTEVLGEGQGILKEGEMQTEVVQVLDQSSQHNLEQQPQDPSLFWEGFLPNKSLKVLVVEDDDATRRVICALLQKCGYEVTAVASGLQAWNVLRNNSIHIDLVLTEVVVPGLSGFDLLSRLMSHRTYKDIPVIMMSTNNSLSMVFKCLSKGAAAFLVKPIRKNELANIWQHAWRKSCSSSGSASENGVQTQKTRSTSVEESDNNNGSNHQDDIEILGVDARDEKESNDKGSGTEVNIRSSPEAFGKDLAPAATCEGQNKEHGVVITGRDLSMGVPKFPSLQLKEPKEKGLISIVVTNKHKTPIMKSLKDDDKLEKGQVGNVNIASHSPLVISSEEEKAKALPVLQFNLNSTPLSLFNDCSNNKGMDSATNDFLVKQRAALDKPELKYKMKHLETNFPFKSHYDIAVEAADFGPSDVPGTHIEGNVGNQSLHGSEYSGSNHNSDDQNMSSSPIDSREEKEGSISPVEVGSKSGVDQYHVSRREAASNNFRQKRKARCFDKKVRYQSRKKLADQRSRICGKFIQEKVHKNKGKDTHC